MRFLVVGTGSIGQRHARNLRALGHDVLVFDSDAGRLRVAADIPGCLPVGGLAAGLEQCPDGVLVCTPPAAHLDIARDAILAGAHVFVEKPIAESPVGVEEVLTLARERRRTVLVGCNLRFFRSLLRVKGFLDQGRVGRILSARADCGFYLPSWRPGRDYRQTYSARASEGGGILLDAIHEFDYLRWLLGEVAEVFCVAGRWSDLAIDVEDLAEVSLRFASGTLAQLHLDYLRRSYTRSCEFIGEDGVIVWDYIARTVTLYHGEPDRWGGYREPIDDNHGEMFVEEMRHFVRCVSGEDKPLVDGAEGLQVLRIVEAAKASAGKRQWVSLG